MSTDDGSNNIVRLTRENIQLREKLGIAENRIADLQTKLSQQAIHIYGANGVGSGGAAPKTLEDLKLFPKSGLTGAVGNGPESSLSSSSPQQKQQGQGDVVPAEEFDQLEEELEAARLREKSLRAELAALKGTQGAQHPPPHEASDESLAQIKKLRQRVAELESSERRLQSAVQDLNDALEQQQQQQQQQSAPDSPQTWATPLAPPPTSQGGFALNQQSTYQHSRTLPQREGTGGGTALHGTIGGEEDDVAIQMTVEWRREVETLQQEIASWQELSEGQQEELEQLKQEVAAAQQRVSDEQVARRKAEQQLQMANARVEAHRSVAGRLPSADPQTPPHRGTTYVNPNAGSSSSGSDGVGSGGSPLGSTAADHSPLSATADQQQQQHTPKHLLVVIQKLEKQNKTLEKEVQSYREETSVKQSAQMKELTDRCLQYTNEVAKLKETLAAVTLERDKAMKAGKRAFLDRTKAIRDLNDIQAKREEEQEARRKHDLMLTLQAKTKETNNERVQVWFTGAWSTMEAIQSKLAELELLQQHQQAGDEAGAAAAAAGFTGADDWASLVCEALFDYERRLWNSNNDNLSLQAILKLNSEESERSYLKKQREMEEEILLLRENMRDGMKLAEEVRELRARLREGGGAHHGSGQHLNSGAPVVGRVVDGPSRQRPL